MPDIANRLAPIFSNTSSDRNYFLTFRIHKEIQERNNISFNSNNQEMYNRAFTIQDLNHNLNNTKNAALGFDGINYKMIKQMPDQEKEYLCKLLNKFFRESYFPEKWRMSNGVPIPKPRKSNDLSVNYRPIALTSCLCKLFERMINERLMEYLHMNNISLQTYNVAGRKERVQ